MIAKKHIVKTVLFDAAAADENVANHFSMTVRKMNMESAMSKALQAFDESEDWIRIDRLEIDMGEMGWENEDKWNTKIITEVRNQLAEKIDRNRLPKNSEPGLTHTNSSAKEDILYLNEGQYRLEAIKDYLLTGTWSCQFDQFADLPDQLEKLVDENPGGIVTHLRSLLMDNREAVNRIIALLGPAQLLKLVKLFSGDRIADELMVLYSILERLVPGIRTRNSRQQFMRVFVMTAAKEGRNAPRLMECIYEVLLESLLSLGIKEVRRVIQDLRIQYNKTNDLDNLLNFYLEHKLSTPVLPIERGILAITRPVEVKPVLQGDKEKEEQLEENPAVDNFINNSGIVLLNPSLLKFGFEKLGWVRGQDFVSERTRQKALLWMHYLTYGDQPIREYQLTLNKVLCGMHPRDLAQVKLNLTRKEKRQAIELLNVVAENWTALKKITIEGLRESFLQRTGKLKYDEGGWQLHVESKGYDILIEQLPWTYSVIKFPWMTKPLFTQWQTRI